MKISGVVVRVIPMPLEDNVALVKILTSSGLLTKKIKNIYEITNKNILLTTPLLYANFVFSSNYLKEMSLINEINYMNDFNKLIFINFINEITIFLFDENGMPSIYPYLIEIIKLLNKNIKKKDILFLLLIFLTISLRLNGLTLNVDSCVLTGLNKNIIAVSFTDGGFISQEVYEPHKHKLYSFVKRQILQKIFKCEIKNLFFLDFSKNVKEVEEIINDLSAYVYDEFNVCFKSIKLIKYLT